MGKVVHVVIEKSVGCSNPKVEKSAGCLNLVMPSHVIETASDSVPVTSERDVIVEKVVVSNSKQKKAIASEDMYASSILKATSVNK